LEEALQNLESAEKDLDRLIVEMDVVAEYWSGANVEVQDIEARFRALQNDDTFQMRIKALDRDWTGVAEDHKRYKASVSAVHA
jgi:chromosome segregation ATPase